MKVITENPAADVLPPKREHPAPTFFNEDELNKVFELVQGNPIAPAVILAGNYGLRRQDEYVKHRAKKQENFFLIYNLLMKKAQLTPITRPAVLF